MARPALVLLALLGMLVTACSDDEPTMAPASSSSSTTTEAPSTATSEERTSSSQDGVPPASATTTPPGEGTPLTGPAGSGDIDYTLARERSEFCYRITVRDLGEPTEAHVHRSTGEVVLALEPPAEDSTVDTCAATDALLIEEMASTPRNFYIDVHAPRGVLRATLE